MIPSFVATYRNEQQLRVYFYPGQDDLGRVTSKIEFPISSNFNYKYVKNVDRSTEYVITECGNILEFDIIDISTKRRTHYKYEVKQIKEF